LALSGVIYPRQQGQQDSVIGRVPDSTVGDKKRQFKMVTKNCAKPVSHPKTPSLKITPLVGCDKIII
jgi:hypothetical protein